MYLVTGISLLVRRNNDAFSCIYALLSRISSRSPAAHSAGSRYSTNTYVHIYISIHTVFTHTYPTTIGYKPGALAFSHTLSLSPHFSILVSDISPLLLQCLVANPPLLVLDLMVLSFPLLKISHSQCSLSWITSLA